jgi:hypothetical protein
MVLSHISVFSQNIEKALTPGTSMVFYGVDFTRVRSIETNVSATQMKNKYFAAINTLLYTEKEKYNFAKFLKKSAVEYEQTSVNAVNGQYDTTLFYAKSITDIQPLTSENLSEMVKKYNLGDKEGIGAVFIAEVLDKPGEKGLFHFVYFSLPDGNVILSERFAGTPGGFGVRNYWAGAIYGILKNNIYKKLQVKYLPDTK